jgi:hypothetical protein
MPTKAWAGFPPGPPKPGHFRSIEQHRWRHLIEHSWFANRNSTTPTQSDRTNRMPITAWALFPPGSARARAFLLFQSTQAVREPRLHRHDWATAARRMPQWLGWSFRLIRPSRGVHFEGLGIGDRGLGAGVPVIYNKRLRGSFTYERAQTLVHLIATRSSPAPSPQPPAP